MFTMGIDKNDMFAGSERLCSALGAGPQHTRDKALYQAINGAPKGSRRRVSRERGTDRRPLGSTTQPWQMLSGPHLAVSLRPAMLLGPCAAVVSSIRGKDCARSLAASRDIDLWLRHRDLFAVWLVTTRSFMNSPPAARKGAGAFMGQRRETRSFRSTTSNGS